MYCSFPNCKGENYDIQKKCPRFQIITTVSLNHWIFQKMFIPPTQFTFPKNISNLYIELFTRSQNTREFASESKDHSLWFIGKIQFELYFPKIFTVLRTSYLIYPLCIMVTKSSGIQRKHCKTVKLIKSK